MEFTASTFTFDIAYMAMLVIVSQFIRAKFKFIQNIFLPAPLIAGALAIVLGPQVLDIIPFSNQMSKYTWIFIVIMYGGLFLGKKDIPTVKSILKDVGDTFAVSLGAELFQIGFAMTGIAFIIKIFWPEINEAFAVCMPGGFYGGHGTGPAMLRPIIALNGWEQGMDVVLTFATIGLLVAAIVGVIHINYGVRRGYTRFINTMDKLPDEMRTGFLSDGSMNSVNYSQGQGTTHNMSLGSSTWHFCFLMFVWFVATVVPKLLGKVLPPSISVPETSVAMIFSLILMIILNKVKISGKPVSHFIDKTSNDKLAGIASDMLVAFGIGSMNLKVVATYAVPIAVAGTIGVVITSFWLYFVAKRVYKEYWFERGMFMFGWCTGSTGMGMVLTKIVDPDNRSKAVEAYGLQYIILCVIEAFLLIVIAPFVAGGTQHILGFILLALATITIVVAGKVYGLKDKNGAKLRPTEVGAEGVINFRK